MWVDQRTSNRKAIRQKWKQAFLPFSLGSAVAIAFCFYKIQTSVCGNLLLLTNVPSLLYHCNRARGTISEIIFHLENRQNKEIQNRWDPSWTPRHVTNLPAAWTTTNGGWAARMAAVFKGRHGARFCFHLHPSHPAKQLGDQLWPHAAHFIPRLLPLTQRYKIWHWRHSKTVMPHSTWVLFAKRGSTVGGKRSTEGLNVLQNVNFSLATQTILLVLQKRKFLS